MRRHAAVKDRRHGVAAVEFAVCLPLMCLVLTGLWEVGRITEVSGVMWNSAREAARDASLGEDNLQTVTKDPLTGTVTGGLLYYLQSAEPTAFGQGHLTTMIAPVISLPANTTGYTCWDNTANRELFTITFHGSHATQASRIPRRCRSLMSTRSAFRFPTAASA